MRYWLLIIISLFFSACRTDEVVISSSSNYCGYVYNNIGDIKGFFLLNEGNMGSNKATLDYFDYTTGFYHKNIFAERNPDVVFELGDVGNDLKVYDDRLYALINNSNLVEVMDLSTAVHIDAIAVPSPRFIAFKGDYAYVSSFDCNVYKLDLNTLEIVSTCAVGLNPEQLVIVGDKLYVANSYSSTDNIYDNTVSVIDLTTFTESKKIIVAENCYSLKVDDNDNLWVSTWGNYDDIPSQTHLINTLTDSVEKSFDIANNRMSYYDDMLYILNDDGNLALSTTSQQIEYNPFIIDSSYDKMQTPHAMAINSETGEILISDAGNYVTPGTLYCYAPDGTLRWSTTTGDIPSSIAFTTKVLEPADTYVEPNNIHVAEVLEYVPVSGYYVNSLPEYTLGNTQSDMNQKAYESLEQGYLITLGGWGGYITVRMKKTIENKDGFRDFRVRGNAWSGNAEPGVIMVSKDENGNGLADDTWYEVKGSEHNNATENHTKTYSTDSSGFPSWISSELSFTGTLLPDNATFENNKYVLNSYEYGYADNVSNTDDNSAIDISWASEELTGVDFIKIYSGVDKINGWLYECSTEIIGVDNLHLQGVEIETIK